MIYLCAGRFQTSSRTSLNHEVPKEGKHGKPLLQMLFLTTCCVFSIGNLQGQENRSRGYCSVRVLEAFSVFSDPQLFFSKASCKVFHQIRSVLSITKKNYFHIKDFALILNSTGGLGQLANGLAECYCLMLVMFLNQ